MAKKPRKKYKVEIQTILGHNIEEIASQLNELSDLLLVNNKLEHPKKVVAGTCLAIINIDESAPNKVEYEKQFSKYIENKKRKKTINNN